MGWCDDPKSDKYNQLIKLPFNYNHEKLFKKNDTYDVVLVLNYNTNPIRKNRGSAIFIHVKNKYYKKTQGCVAVNKLSLLRIIKEMKKGTKIRIVSQR